MTLDDKMLLHVANNPLDHDLKLVTADWYEDCDFLPIAAALRWLARRGLAPCFVASTDIYHDGKEWAWVDDFVASGDKDETSRMNHSGGHISAALRNQRHALVPSPLMYTVVWEHPTCLAAYIALITHHSLVTEALK